MSLHDFSLVCANKRLVRAGTACSGPGPRKCVACASHQYGAVGPPVALLTAAGGRALRRGVDMFLPVSGAVAAGCALGTRGERFEIVPNFLPDDPPVAAPDDPRLQGLPEEPFILFVGDVTHDKGVDVLLDAHARMAVRTPLVLIGRLAEPELLAGREGVLALGPIAHDGVLAAWRRGSVGVVPSVQPEAFGVVALEASCAGIPVVASAHGGLPDVIADGETGILVPPGDAAALGAALDRLMADAGLRSTMGVAGAARAARFSAAAVVPRVEVAYGAALAARLGRK
jgi:glycosyltransferase involved in cell wall biosynthesis